MLPSGWNTYIGTAIQVLSGMIAILTYLTTGTMNSETATGLFGLYAVGGGVAKSGQAKQSTLMKAIALQEKVPVAVAQDLVSQKK
jgi:hypothetical protein